jgi:hypothetical protein
MLHCICRTLLRDEQQEDVGRFHENIEKCSSHGPVPPSSGWKAPWDAEKAEPGTYPFNRCQHGRQTNDGSLTKTVAALLMNHSLRRNPGQLKQWNWCHGSSGDADPNNSRDENSIPIDIISFLLGESQNTPTFEVSNRPRRHFRRVVYNKMLHCICRTLLRDEPQEDVGRFHENIEKCSSHGPVPPSSGWKAPWDAEKTEPGTYPFNRCQHGRQTNDGSLTKTVAALLMNHSLRRNPGQLKQWNWCHGSSGDADPNNSRDNAQGHQ